MAKYSNEFKQFIIEERLLKKKTLPQIEIFDLSNCSNVNRNSNYCNFLKN